MSRDERNRRLDRSSPAATIVLVAVLILVSAARPARADNAFPNAQSVLLPRDRPNQIILGTTFGLVITDDDGAVWQYACENALTRMSSGGMYALGPAPQDRIYATSDMGAPITTDGACTWSLGGGDVVASVPRDVFPDPVDPMRVYLLAGTPDAPDIASLAFRSTDGGMTYQGPIFTAPADSALKGIESSASSPGTVYLPMVRMTGTHPSLVRSTDGGDNWTTIDIEPGVGAVVPYLAAIDPTDARHLYLRITSSEPYEGLAITPDGGATWTIPLKVPTGTLAGFARLPTGNLVAIGTTAPTIAGGAGTPAVFRSDDAGVSFSTQGLPFHGAGLSQRNGRLYAATNSFLDGFAMSTSDDGGQSWTMRLRFKDIATVRGCVRESCQNDCDLQAGIRLFPPEVCNPPDGGSTDAAAPDAGPTDAATSPKPGKGCGCGVESWGSGSSGALVGVAVLLLALGSCGRWRRRPPA